MKANIKSGHTTSLNKISIAGMIVTMGIVYGDIGTSPLYVMKAILGSASIVDVDFVLGALSCIIWTLTLQTTLKYIIITLRADNKGEGGIFSLFALVRKKYRWAYIFAIIGGCAMLADGIITPSITVVSAIEGLRLINPGVPVIPIVLIIITSIFLIQQFGTKAVGTSFGPIMLIWFSSLMILGLNQIVHYPMIFKAFNPYYAIKLLVEYPMGYLLLGAVFLCTTGAEALYSDLGHCGLKNIRMSWIFVKSALIINYLGQGAWVINNMNTLSSATNPFYAIMPSWFLIPGIILATAAAIIASQALITGSFTLISEAMSLNFWPRVKRVYPTLFKGQVYIPSVNWFLYFSCVFVILFFQESSKMEAAYGLTISIAMLMTTILLTLYMFTRHFPKYIIYSLMVTFIIVEVSFLGANFVKFFHGGWFTFVIAGLLYIIMYGWYNARRLRNKFLIFVKLSDYIEVLKDLSQDNSVPKYATNLVYISRANSKDELESKIIYSIINKQPKRADIYWFVHVDIVDEPKTFEYEINQYVPGKIIKVDFRLGFKIEPRINMYFKQVLQEMVENNEIDILSKYDSLRKYNINGDFQFVVIDRLANSDYDFSFKQRMTINLYRFLKNIGISEVKAYGLDTSNVLVEKVPLINESRATRIIKRKAIHYL